MNCRSLGLALVLMYPALGVRAEPLPDLIDRMKPSAVLVGSHGLLDSPRFGFRGA
jgi:hypothetical protein